MFFDNIYSILPEEQQPIYITYPDRTKALHSASYLIKRVKIRFSVSIGTSTSPFTFVSLQQY